MLVIGQEQDTMGGGFSTNEALVGSLTLFNIWDEELPLADIESMRTSCDIKPGNVVAWSAVKAAMRGTLRSKPSPFCKGKRLRHRVMTSSSVWTAAVTSLTSMKSPTPVVLNVTIFS